MGRHHAGSGSGARDAARARSVSTTSSSCAARSSRSRRRDPTSTSRRASTSTSAVPMKTALSDHPAVRGVPAGLGRRRRPGGVGDRRRRVRRSRDDACADRRPAPRSRRCGAASPIASGRASSATRPARFATRATRSSRASASRRSGRETEDPNWYAPAARPRDVARRRRRRRRPRGRSRRCDREVIACVSSSAVRQSAASARLQPHVRPLVDWLVRECDAARCRRWSSVPTLAPSAGRGASSRRPAAGRACASTRSMTTPSCSTSSTCGSEAVRLPDGAIVLFDPIGGPIAVSLAEELGERAILITQDQIAGNELSRTGDLAPANVRLAQRGVRIEKRRSAAARAPRRASSWRTASAASGAPSRAPRSSTAASACRPIRCPARSRRSATALAPAHDPRSRPRRPSRRPRPLTQRSPVPPSRRPTRPLASDGVSPPSWSCVRDRQRS